MALANDSDFGLESPLMPFPLKLWSVRWQAQQLEHKEQSKWLTFTHACGQDMHMAVAVFVQFLDISDKIHALRLTEKNR